MPVANLTLAAIETAILADGGARFRSLLKETFAALTDAYSPKAETFRSHLGASLIGRPCARELWFSWHWCTKPKHDARTLRLFNRGHLEEARFVALLQLIGCSVWGHGEDGKQLTITGASGHFGGSLDSVVLGLPEMPSTPVLAEYKTHGEKSFAALKSEGVMKAKWEHYVQFNVYAHKKELSQILYLAVNKNNDDLYAELLPVDTAVAEQYEGRAVEIIRSPEPPGKINNSPAWFQCKFCDHHTLCHNFAYPEVNCRTCAHSTPVENGSWTCEKTNTPIPKSMEACSSYIVNPSILNGIEILDANMQENWMVYKCKDGTTVDTRKK